MFLKAGVLAKRYGRTRRGSVYVPRTTGQKQVMRVARVSWLPTAAAILAAALAGCGTTATGAKAPSRLTPSRPTLGSPVLKVRSVSTNGIINGGPQVNYTFTADPILSTATGSATAYKLDSPKDVAAVTSTIARALGLSEAVTYLGPGNYNGGPSPGPDVTVDTVAGVLNWQYPTWSGSRSQPIPSNPSIAVDPNAALPTDNQATTDAEQLLEAAGVSGGQLGVPTVSRYEAGVNVAFSIVAGGIPTDQSMQVEYGPGATVLTATGVIETATPTATYPTISATDAVGLLTNSSGSVSGGTIQSSVTVDIDQATMALSTSSLADGASWLLPTWTLSGSESGSTAAAGSVYTTSVLAVPATYIQQAPAT